MQNTETELENILSRIRPANRLRKITVGIAFIMVVGALMADLLPHPEWITEIAVILCVWFFSVFIFEFLVRKAKTASGASNLYLGYEAMECLFLTGILYNQGGAEWMGAMFFLFIIIYGNIVLSGLRGFITSTMVGVFYTSLVLLEYFGLIPFRELFPIGVNLHQNPNYLLITVLFVWFAFYFTGWATGLLAGLLKKRTLELEKTKTALERSKTVLEIKVMARTEELETERASLEEKVKERTKELQGRIDELEKFHKLTVGRELKMVELKEEIERLRQEFKK